MPTDVVDAVLKAALLLMSVLGGCASVGSLARLGWALAVAPPDATLGPPTVGEHVTMGGALGLVYGLPVAVSLALGNVVGLWHLA
ncbi:hypothetical protein [Cellulomonas alba]|uniref:Lipoprotein n=1 Tax=Cellulomonas alba TaxID=3053467 RepID=A0ABT7SHP8_9CELL|nr:hypothetical protein [Cellulomonas alba]MDM7855712.1 hypothetical protein [Cellulomonas alba]